jgi:phosphatidylglycerol:prolipoprotein diacylglycerol transferase
MFIHNIDPVLVNIGPLAIRYYGLVYVVGFLIAYFVLRWAAINKKVKNLTKERVDTLLLYIIIGTIVGARVLEFVFYNPSIFWTNPLEVLYVWHGGMSFHGGLIGIAVATWLFCRKYKVKFYDLADLLAIPAAFIFFLGRIANFINAELVGNVTNVSWGVNFNNEYDAFGNRVFRHPVQIYESLKNLLIFFILLFVSRSKKFAKGFIFWLFVLLYGILRFITNFWRDEPRFLGITMGQYLSLAMVVLALIFLYRLWKKEKLIKK